MPPPDSAAPPDALAPPDSFSPLSPGGLSGAGGNTSTRGSEPAAAGASGGPLAGAPVSASCAPRLVGSELLPAACAGEQYFARLQLECSERGAAPVSTGVRWQPTALPAELTLTAQGELLGSAALSAGTHELRVQAQLAGGELELSLQLEVLERCFVFMAARAPAAEGWQSQTRILAQRLDAAAAAWLPENLAEGSSVLGFDRSSDGRWLAATSSSATGQRLLLFQLRAGSVTELQIEHAGAHVAHAFSPDSARLAVLTELAAPAGAPPARRLSLVELGSLGAEDRQLTLEEELALPYQQGLAWSDPGTLQFIGVSPQFPTFFTPHVLSIPASGLSAAQLSELLYPMDPADLIRWFHPLPGGFYVMSNALVFVDASGTLAAPHLQAQALSPTYEYSAHTADGRLLLHAPDLSDDQPATLEASGCERLLAWSSDGQTLLCELEGRLTQLQLSESELSATPLDTPWPAGGVQRSVLSSTGHWSALADDEHGLFLLESGVPPPAEPLLPVSPAEPGWDFAISHDERHLWIQQGGRLSMAGLNTGESAQLTLLSESMAAPAPCAESGLPLPGEWCGAPERAGPVQLRREGRYLAFADASGALTVVDMAAPARRHEPRAQLANECTEHCIQFQ